MKTVAYTMCYTNGQMDVAKRIEAALAARFLMQDVREKFGVTFAITVIGPENEEELLSMNSFCHGTAMSMGTLPKNDNDKASKYWVRRANGWIRTDDMAGINEILGCFGLNVSDIFKHYGMPTAFGTRYEVKLVDIVRELAPQYISVS